jgi:hypothetical protein
MTRQPAATDTAAYALAAARRGWHVFRVRPSDKRAAVTDWEHQATTDPARVCELFATPANIGIATGPSGLVVLDLDTPKHATAERDASDAATGDALRQADASPCTRSGADVLAALCAEHRQPYPADTFTVRTRRGTHLYYAAPPGPHLRNTKGGTPRGLGPLIDTRAHGGYVVGPGSYVSLPDGSGPYLVIRRDDPAPLPGWLADLLTAPPNITVLGAPDLAAPVACTTAYARAALDHEIQRVLSSPDREHNWALNKAAYNLGRHIAAGILPEDTVAAALQAAGETVHEKDTPDQIAKTVRVGITAGIRRGTR